MTTLKDTSTHLTCSCWTTVNLHLDLRSEGS